jgi:hypothetical protein
LETLNWEAKQNPSFLGVYAGQEKEGRRRLTGEVVDHTRVQGGQGIWKGTMGTHGDTCTHQGGPWRTKVAGDIVSGSDGFTELICSKNYSLLPTEPSP